MPDEEIEVLKTAGDLGLDEPDIERVAVTVSAALDLEYEKERRPVDLPQSSGKWNRRRRFVVAVSLALIVGGGTAVGYAALTGSSTASDGIGCYPGDEIGGSVTVANLDGRRATKTCADLWAEGAVGQKAQRPPNPLHACVSREGGGPIRVLTSADTSICNRVGLVADPNAGLDPQARQFGAFSTQLSNTLARNERNGFSCTGREQMKRLVEQLLREHELTGWNINESGKFDQVNRCATLGLDSDSQTVTMFAGRP